MHIFKLLKTCVNLGCLIFLILINSALSYAQTGTYQNKLNNGAYSVISFEKSGNKVTAEIFAWWNTKNAQMGYYSGTGTLKSSVCVLRSDENDPGCKVTLTIVGKNIDAKFSDCATDHLTEDFNGSYTKFTNAVAGDYVINVPKAYFYKKPNSEAKFKAYVLKGDKVTLDIDRIAASKGEWLYVYFTSKTGKETAGYIQMSELKKME